MAVLVARSLVWALLDGGVELDAIFESLEGRCRRVGSMMLLDGGIRMLSYTPLRLQVSCGV